MQAAMPLPLFFHLSAAVAALLLGIVMLVRPKGTRSHRMIGRTWAVLMLAVAISSLWLPSFLHFSWIHLFTLLTLIALPRAIWKIRHGDVLGHSKTMKRLFFGALLIAGLFTLVPGRLLGNLLWHGEWPFGSVAADAGPVQRAAAAR